MLTDEAMLDQVYRQATRIRRKRLVITGLALVVLAGIGGGIARSARDEPIAVVASEVQPEPELRLSVSPSTPRVGEEVTFTLEIVGGIAAYGPNLDTGDPAAPLLGSPGFAFQCGYRLSSSERVTTRTWAYRDPGRYEVEASASLVDPCTSEVGTRITSTITVLVRP